MTNISLSHIAEKAGTSKATVSRAFNYTPGISNEMRSRIFKIAAEMGYVQNKERSQHAKMLRPGAIPQPASRKRSDVVTLLFYNSTRDQIASVPYYKALTRLMDATFRSEGLSLIESYPQNEPEYLRIVETSATDGIIIVANIQQLGADFLAMLKIHSNRQPLIFLSNYPKSFQNQFHSVRSDDVSVGFTAADYCCKSGNGAVLFVDSGFGMAVAEDRYLGYRRAMEQHNRPPVRIPFQDDAWFQHGVSGITGGLSLPQGPVCFIGAADSTIFFFIEFLKKEGLHDPSRMRFVGMDGIPALEQGDPREATVRVDLESMARETYHLLNDALEGKVLKPKSILVGSELMVKPGGLQ